MLDAFTATYLWAEQLLTRQLDLPTEAFYPFSWTQKDEDRSVKFSFSFGPDLAVAEWFTLEEP